MGNKKNYSKIYDRKIDIGKDDKALSEARIFLNKELGPEGGRWCVQKFNDKVQVWFAGISLPADMTFWCMATLALSG